MKGLIPTSLALAAASYIWSPSEDQFSITAGITDSSDTVGSCSDPGIYTSSDTPSERYGGYNYCNMPHVRKQEYKVSSKEYKLEYVEVIQRHHKRTPYALNTFFVEDIQWECDGSGPYAHARRSDGVDSAQIYWQAQKGTSNPFEYTVGPGFVNSTCQFPGITTAGIEDARVHGEDFRGVYGELLGFLPTSGEREKFQFRVTNNIITSQTLGGFAKGLYPDSTEHSTYIQNSVYDSLQPGFRCPAAGRIKADQLNSAEWERHMHESANLRRKLNRVSGIEEDDTAGWKDSWDHYFDNLSAKQCHQKPLPCSVNDTALCVTQEEANQVYKLGNWEYAYWWRNSPDSLRRSALTMGPWFKELQGHFKQVEEGNHPVKYYHNFAHDGSVGPVLGVLQIDKPVWPGTGAEVVFELWQKDSKHYIRVLWSGQPLRTTSPLGTIDMVKLSDFNAYLNSVIPMDPVAACSA